MSRSQSILEKIDALDSIEEKITQCLTSAGKVSWIPLFFTIYQQKIIGQALQELAKEKSSQKAAENHTQAFIKNLTAIEKQLSEQINYLTQVSTGHPHEGSSYASAKVLQMGWHRSSQARDRLMELEELRSKYTQVNAQRQQQQQIQQQQQPQPQ
ncbi:MED11 family protein [Megaselia abdita]